MVTLILCLFFSLITFCHFNLLASTKAYTDPERVGGGDCGSVPSLENHEAVGFLRNSGMDPPGKSQIYPASILCSAFI